MSSALPKPVWTVHNMYTDIYIFKFKVFWYITSCSPLDGHQWFGSTSTLKMDWASPSEMLQSTYQTKQHYILYDYLLDSPMQTYNLKLIFLLVCWFIRFKYCKHESESQSFLLFTCDSMPLRHWRASLATTLRNAGSALHNHCLALMGCWDMNWEPSTLRRPNKGCSNVSGSEHSTMSLRPWNSADAAATSSSDIYVGSSQTVRRHASEASTHTLIWKQVVEDWEILQNMRFKIPTVIITCIMGFCVAATFDKWIPKFWRNLLLQYLILKTKSDAKDSNVDKQES
jgi:hypothetical protein